MDVHPAPRLVGRRDPGSPEVRRERLDDGDARPQDDVSRALGWPAATLGDERGGQIGTQRQVLDAARLRRRRPDREDPRLEVEVAPRESLGLASPKPCRGDERVGEGARLARGEETGRDGLRDLRAHPSPRSLASGPPCGLVGSGGPRVRQRPAARGREQAGELDRTEGPAHDDGVLGRPGRGQRGEGVRRQAPGLHRPASERPERDAVPLDRPSGQPVATVPAATRCPRPVRPVVRLDVPLPAERGQPPLRPVDRDLGQRRRGRVADEATDAGEGVLPVARDDPPGLKRVGEGRDMVGDRRPTVRGEGVAALRGQRSPHESGGLHCRGLAVGRSEGDADPSSVGAVDGRPRGRGPAVRRGRAVRVAGDLAPGPAHELERLAVGLCAPAACRPVARALVVHGSLPRPLRSRARSGYPGPAPRRGRTRRAEGALRRR